MMKLSEEYDEAILGQCYHSERFVYSWDKVVEIAQKELQTTYADAFKYVEYNLVSARFNEEPIWLYKEVQS